MKMRIVNEEGMENCENKRYFSLPHFCLVVEKGWRSGEIENFFVWLRSKMGGQKIQFYKFSHMPLLEKDAQLKNNRQTTDQK